MSSSSENEDWRRAWDPVIANIGQEFLIRPADNRRPDAIEPGAIRKYLEPLEFDCALHTDPEVARAHGFSAVTAPYTAATSFTIPPMWLPGETLFSSDDPDAQPVKSAVKPEMPTYFPPVTGYFATDVDFEFVRPALAGETVFSTANTIVSCEPKETSVGRGAFLKSVSSIVTEEGEVIARMFTGMFMYNPHPGAGA